MWSPRYRCQSCQAIDDEEHELPPVIGERFRDVLVAPTESEGF